MLSLLVVLYALFAIQGEAFPSRYKRNYQASYHYIPFEEGLVRLPAGYSPHNFQNYPNYIHGYVQTHGHDWPVYYQPVPSQSIKNPYSNVNEHHKMKAGHNWHFVDHSHVPITGYRDGSHQFESDVEAPNVIESLVKKEHQAGDDAEYDIPIVVEALERKDINHGDAEVPIVDSLAIKGKPIKHDKHPVITDSLINYRNFHAHKYKEANSDLLDNTWEESATYEPYQPVKIGPDMAEAFKLPVEIDTLTKKEKQATYVGYEPAKDKPIKKHQFISSNEFDLPNVNSLDKKDKHMKVQVDSYGVYGIDVGDSIGKKDEVAVGEFFSHNKEKPIKEKPIKEKPIKEKPIVVYEESRYYPDALNEEVEDYEAPLVVEALIRKEKPPFHMEEEYDTPVVVEALVRKHPPVYENKKINDKGNKINPKDSFYPDNESDLIKDDVKNLNIPVVEALSLDENTENDQILKQKGNDFDETNDFNNPEIDSFDDETSKQEGVQFDEINDFNNPETDSFDESGEDGSAAGFDGSDLLRSFLPVNSNIFSTVKKVNEQERRKFKSCVTPKNETGNCMPFQLCSVMSTVGNIEEVLRNMCIIDEVFIGICCPEFPVETVRVDWEQLKPDADTINEDKTSHISKECGKLSPMVTDQDAWPWMALLIARSSNKIFCGAAVIADQYVLTAAHCTKRIPRNQILVRLGGSTTENRTEPDFEVIEIKRHAGYNPRTMQNDIALLKLSRRIQLGDFRSTVCLTKEEESIEGLVSESASLLRWKETPGEIKDVETLSVISNRECQNKMQTAIADSIICTEPRTDETMCNADSGAPLIIEKDGKFEVIGILTWNRNDCDERFPTVFTRVSSYHRWIEKLTT